MKVMLRFSLLLALAIFADASAPLVAAAAPASDPVLATLGDVEIRESDFKRFVEHSYGTAQVANIQKDLASRRNALDAYFDFCAAAAKARKDGIDRLPTFLKARELMEMKLLVSLFDQRERAQAGVTNSATNRMGLLRAEMGFRETPVARTNVSLLDISAVPTEAILAYVAGEPVREADFLWFIKDAFRAEQRMHAFSRPGAREGLLEAFLQMRMIQAKARKDGLQNQPAYADTFAVLEMRLLAEFLQERDRRNPWNVPGSTDEARLSVMKAYFAGLRAEVGLHEVASSGPKPAVKN